ncbi:MAG: demethoxyubiquinone hydroxylase family protein, partial [Quisquiliibacterium sp.]
HLDRLPAADLRSRALVRAMRDDEIAHAQGAWRLGAAQMHPAAQAAMRLAARVMTVTAHRI